MGSIARRAQAPLGKADAEEPPIIGQQFDIRATEHLFQFVWRHSNFAGSSHLARPRKKAVEIISGASDRLAFAGQTAGTMKLAKVMHNGFPFFKQAAICIRQARCRKYAIAYSSRPSAVGSEPLPSAAALYGSTGGDIERLAKGLADGLLFLPAAPPSSSQSAMARSSDR
jgi:hypothetical protein